MIILELKNTVIEMKNSVDRFNSRMQETEEIIHKWKIDQSKQQSKTVNRAWGTCGTIIKDWTFVSSEHWKERRNRAEMNTVELCPVKKVNLKRCYILYYSIHVTFWNDEILEIESRLVVLGIKEGVADLYLYCVNVNILVKILPYSFARCSDWEKLGKGYMRPLLFPTISCHSTIISKAQKIIKVHW